MRFSSKPHKSPRLVPSAKRINKGLQLKRWRKQQKLLKQQAEANFVAVEIKEEPIDTEEAVQIEGTIKTEEIIKTEETFATEETLATEETVATFETVAPEETGLASDFEVAASSRQLANVPNDYSNMDFPIANEAHLAAFQMSISALHGKRVVDLQTLFSDICLMSLHNTGICSFYNFFFVREVDSGSILSLEFECSKCKMTMYVRTAEQK
ncbi:uncharacterized protein LOC125179043 isoform X2 [Hyalella azteca]|uniref:Uncharacterized protein LOC125179043 isoform X2 n=1 Tax=Hyalella azteca TaxID=294128 RepID=A0A979FSE7_HYAAZ|nr:uncharacterized protein LOC125179043 isoform X2 [Hyalella azteca]